MSQIYIGNPAYVTQITIPDDGDLASAASVNNPAKASADMDYFLLQSIGQITQGAPIKISCTDGSTIDVSAIPLAIVNENGLFKTISTNSTVNIGVANLEIGANYVSNSWYYIYIFSNAGNAAFQISLAAPDPFNLFKQGSDSHRYIGSFRVGPASTIYKFSASRGQYMYMDTQTLLTGGNSTSEARVDISSAIPPTSRVVDLHLSLTNSSPLTSYVKLLTYSGGSFYQFIAYLQSSYDYSYTMQTNTDQSIRYLTGAATTNLSITILGYKE